MSGALEIGGSPSPLGRTQSLSAQSVAPGAPSAPAKPSSNTDFKVVTVNVIQDPAAGFITEYLSAHSGEVVSQIPSAITVAYLRQGLSPDGIRAEAKSVTTTA